VALLTAAATLASVPAPSSAGVSLLGTSTPPGAIVQSAAQDTVEEARDLFRQALAAAQDEEFATARGLVQQGLRLQPRDPDGLNLLGEIEERLGDWRSAVAAYDLARIADPEWLVPLSSLGRVYLEQNEFLLALPHLRRATELAPQDPVAFALLGSAQRGLGRTRASRDSFRRAWELAPDSLQLGVDLSRAQFADADLNAAIATAETLTEQAPDQSLGWFTLGNLLIESPDVDHLVRAPAAFRKAIEADPSAPLLWLRLASVYSELGLTAEREAALRQAIALGADGTDIWLALGDALDLQSKHPEAIEAFTRVIERDPSDGRGYFRRGKVYLSMNDRDAAEADVEKAIVAMPEDVDALLTMAQFQLNGGDPETAETFVDRAYAVIPGSPDADLMLGRIRVQQGRSAEAIPLLERAAANPGDQIDAEYLLGQALLREGETDRGQALMAAYQAKLQERRDYHVESLRLGVMGRGRVYKIRGRIYLQEGRHDQALEQLIAATEMMPDDSEAWALLATVYEAMGRGEEAAAARATAASLGGESAQ
jgi:tetratricopeptide (TPR) repeat protein